MKTQSSRQFLARLALRRLFRAPRMLPLAVAMFAATLGIAPSTYAASGVWLGATDAFWATDTNWSSGAHPVTGDTATFSNDAPTVNNRTTIDLGTGQAAAAVVFDTTTAAAYTIGAGAAGSQTLTLDTTGAITLGLAAASAPATSQLFNANVVLGTAAVGTTTITNNATAASLVALNFAGTVTGGTGGTAGLKTVNIVGTGAVNFTNALGAGSSTGVNLANTGTGITTLSGAVTSTLNTLRATGSGGQMVVNGQTVTVAASSVFGGSTIASKFILTSGSAAFNGGISSGTTSGVLAGADGQAFIVNGGTFSTSSVSLGRSFNFSTTSGAITATAVNMTTNGFQVNGGTASVTGVLGIFGSNSAGSGQVTGTGSLTVGGELDLGTGSTTSSQNSTRTNLFQVTGGTLTNNDTTGGGIVIGKGTATVAASGEFLSTGGVTTTNKISFGLNGGLAGSFGNLTVNGANATVYVGGGGIVLAATNAFTSSINLTAGTLGATADWASTMNMNLNGAAGTSFTVQAADAGGTAHNITLSGVIGGTGGLTKTGAGTLTLTGANGYSGLTSINAGTLNINGVFALGGANYSGTTFNGGTLQYAAGTGGAFSTTAGGGDISNFGGAKPVTINAGGATIDTNNNNVTFASPIGNNGAGRLTKVGTGILTLAAANTYTGGTLINGGTLTIGLNGGLSSGNTTVAGGAVLELSSGVTAAHSLLTSTLTLSATNSTLMLDGPAGTVQDTVQTLIVNGVALPNGTYGAVGSTTVGVIPLPEITGTGVLAVVPEPSTWMFLFGGMVGLTTFALRRRRVA